MSMRTAETVRNIQQADNLRKYGQSGGKENRGILTNIKAADLPDESLTDFSDTPYEFEETALLVKEDLQRLYYHAGTANRFSEKYLKFLPQLESYIKQAGSFCLTKAVLEQQGLEFPKLQDLTTPDLIRMVSFHIRKCHAAIEGLYRDNDRLGSVYFQWELRWISLGERLKTTDAKIRKISEGKLRADELLERQEPLRSRPQSGDTVNGFPKSLFVNPHALPLERSMAADMLRREQLIEKQQREYERLKLQSLRALGPDIYRPVPIPLEKDQPAPKPGPESVPPIDKAPEGGITEAEARRILIEDAMKRGDRAALMAIPMEDADTFHARWMRHIQEQSQRPPARSRTGPPEETRKKLREKRKKGNKR